MKTYYALALSASLALPGLLHAEEWTVDGAGGGDYTTIQGAIDDAESRDEIIVYPGTYYEGLDLLGKALQLRSSDGAEVTIVDAEGQGPALQMVSGEGRETSITGFTFTGGSGALNLEGDSLGGGILIEGSEGTLAEVILRDNQADYGGGIAIIDGAVELEDVTLQGNTAGYGGGLYSRGSEVHLTRGIFRENVADYGGALRSYDGELALGGSIFYDNTTLESESGTVALRYLQAGSEVTHLTLVDNDSGLRGAGIQIYASDVVVVNNIVVEDVQGAGIGLTAQTNDARLEYNNTWSNPGGGVLADGEELVGQGGNISADPLFFEADDDLLLLFLFPGSPCINTGDPERLDSDGSRSDMGAYGGTEGFVANWDDSDMDGMPDVWETYYGLDPMVANGDEDADGDGLSNLEEFGLSLDPTDSDSDNDGVSDGDEVQAGQDPLDPLDNLPTADAGSDWSIGRGSYITLDGSASFDPNGDDLVYQWTLLEAPGQSALNGQALPSAAFVEVLVDIRGDYVFELKVFDGLAWSEAVETRAIVHGVRYVPAGYDTIQAAMDAARDGDEIRVAPGVYHESLNFRGKAIAVTSMTGPEETILDGSDLNSIAEFVSGEGFDSQLVGFTLRGINKSGSSVSAVRIEGSAATISNCIFIDNRLAKYPGVWAYQGGVSIVDSLFVENQVGSSYGAVVYVYDSEVTLLRNTFVDNSSGITSSSTVYLNSVTSGLVANNLFQANDLRRVGGVYIYYGTVTLDQNTFVENEGDYTADLELNRTSVSITNSIFAGSPGSSLRSIYSYYSSGPISYGLLNDEGYREDPIYSSSSSFSVEEFTYADPQFDDWSYDGDSSNDHFTLAEDSPAVDAGDPSTFDADGSRADMGIYGGGHSALVDSDGDGAPDYWESRYLLDPNRVDAQYDVDGDGLSTAEEFLVGSSPVLADTDFDGVPDGEEIEGGYDPSDPSDQRPVAFAGDDVDVVVGNAVTLDGSGSIDPNGDALTYTWSLLSVPEESAITDVDLSDSEGITLTFMPDVRGFYYLGLQVSDGKIDSLLDTVMVTALGTLIVPNSFETIQAAVDEALPNESVLIAGGVWEEAVEITKAIVIQPLFEEGAVLIKAPVGQAAFRVLGVSEGTVTLRGLSMAQGQGHSVGGAHYGGGLYMEDSWVKGEGLSFLGNSADFGGAVAAIGGGLTLVDAHFEGNIATGAGGAIYLDGGAHSVTRGVFWSNEGPLAGAIHHEGEALHVEASIFQDNLGVGSGSAGALNLEGAATLQNCTFLENVGPMAADITLWVSDVSINSSIFGGGDGVGVFGYVSVPLTAFTYNTMVGYGAVVGGEVANPINHGGNLALRPRFVSNPRGSTPTGHDLHLRLSSPCIDAGDPSDALNDQDGSINDMGAYGGPEALRE